MAPKKRARASSAPPPAARGDPDAGQPAHAAQTGGATVDQDLDDLGLEGPLLPHVSYESEGEDDAPARVVEDELRHYYRPDGLWFRMRKWWWSVFLWALGQAKVNAYLAYMAVCKGAGKKPMTHLKFHVAIVTAWCTTPEVVLK